MALSLIGGGARSGLWTQMLASLLGVALQVHEHGAAGGAVGAARLAWIADGGAEGDVCKVPDVATTFVSDPAEGSLLLSHHERFRALYVAPRDQFGAMAVAARTALPAAPAEATSWR